jgi:hypothetical protein
MIFPEPAKWTFKVNLKRPVDGPLKSDIRIVRTIAGLDLPIKCWLVLGEQVGSCVYNDLCESILYILNLNKNNCPANFIENGNLEYFDS